jgi:hypothetical protein
MSATANGEGVWYCTREDIKRALDFQSTSQISNSRIDRKIEASSRSIEGDLLRYFFPSTDTQTFDWPDHQFSLPWRLWLDQREMAAAPTQVLAAGVDITAYVLARPDYGPPFTKLEINLGTGSSFNSGATHQRSISVTGVFGYCANEDPAGTLAGTINSSVTTLTVSDGNLVGVGTILRIDSERLIVTDKRMVDTTYTAQGALTANTNSVTLPVLDGTKFDLGETLLVDSERLLITDIGGNNLTVKRAQSGSVLAAHNSGAALYAERLCTVTRGVLGTTAASHTATTAMVRHRVPSLIRDLCIAETVTGLLQEMAGYARTIGTDVVRQVLGVGLEDVRDRAKKRYARLRTRTTARSV